MLSREPRSIALTLLSLAAIAAGLTDPAPERRAESTAGRYRHRQPRGRMTPIRPPPVGGCSWSAACSTPRENLCRGRRSWSMRGTCRSARAPFTSRFETIPLAEGRAGGSGRFRIDAPGRPRGDTTEFGAVALAPAMASAGSVLDPDDDQPIAEISLRPSE